MKQLTEIASLVTVGEASALTFTDIPIRLPDIGKLIAVTEAAALDPECRKILFPTATAETPLPWDPQLTAAYLKDPYSFYGIDNFLAQTRWDDCRGKLILAALRARMSLSPGRTVHDLRCVYDVYAALVLALFGNPPRSVPLLPFARALLELAPLKLSAMPVAAAAAYAAWLTEKDDAARAKAAALLREAGNSVPSTPQAFEHLFPLAIVAAIRRLSAADGPAQGLEALISHDTMSNEARVYYLSWWKHLTGETEKATRYLQTVAATQSPYRDLGADFGYLATVALERLRQPVPGEPAYQDPAILLGYSGYYPVPGKGNEAAFGSSYDYGPVAPYAEVLASREVTSDERLASEAQYVDILRREGLPYSLPLELWTP